MRIELGVVSDFFLAGFSDGGRRCCFVWDVYLFLVGVLWCFLFLSLRRPDFLLRSRNGLLPVTARAHRSLREILKGISCLPSLFLFFCLLGCGVEQALDKERDISRHVYTPSDCLLRSFFCCVSIRFNSVINGCLGDATWTSYWGCNKKDMSAVKSGTLFSYPQSSRSRYSHSSPETAPGIHVEVGIHD